MKQLFNPKINEIKIELGSETTLVRRVQEFDNGTVSGGKMSGYDHNNLDEFLKERGYEYYLIAGRYNCFISHVDSRLGYKFFTVDKVNNTPANEIIMQRMFNIHNDLYLGGFGPKPYELPPGS